ncbi:uncharacterized protein LOC117101106 [Anneissia japonica]|uniref:uncharacterized protein LOC117101106 n=1 Tax=Anneissia japonica TaxID=1529436 RepID=UPI0014256959|nr:uncharacterized protein LOC117101106 [Anneissia japonica]
MHLASFQYRKYILFGINKYKHTRMPKYLGVMKMFIQMPQTFLTAIRLCSSSSQPLNFLELIVNFDKKKKTPFFGIYHCGKCKKGWCSAFSYKGVWQQCKRCQSLCYPFKKKDGNVRRKHPRNSANSHRQDLCGMCHKLGYNCKDSIEDGIASK